MNIQTTQNNQKAFSTQIVPRSETGRTLQGAVMVIKSSAAEARRERIRRIEAAPKRRHFYHGDILEGDFVEGTPRRWTDHRYPRFYNRRKDALEVLAEEVPITLDDVLILRSQLADRWVPHGYYRPESVRNVYADHFWMSLDLR